MVEVGLDAAFASASAAAAVDVGLRPFVALKWAAAECSCSSEAGVTL